MAIIRCQSWEEFRDYLSPPFISRMKKLAPRKAK